MIRQEHMDWCKQRALEYRQLGPYFSLDDAMASMASDVGKHEETRHHVSITIPLMFQLRLAAKLDTPVEMRKFTERFN